LELVDYVRINRDRILWDEKSIEIKNKARTFQVAKAIMKKSASTVLGHEKDR
jgi:hypothetical protein